MCIRDRLITALERAMRLAESMEARGFGGAIEPSSHWRRLAQQLAILGGLAALASGLACLGFLPDRRLLAGSLLAAGGLALGWSFWDQGRRVRRSQYRRWYCERRTRLPWSQKLQPSASPPAASNDPASKRRSGRKPRHARPLA